MVSKRKKRSSCDPIPDLEVSPAIKELMIDHVMIGAKLMPEYAMPHLKDLATRGDAIAEEVLRRIKCIK